MGENLKLITKEEQVEKKEEQGWVDPRKHLISIYNEMYFQETGRKNPFSFGACMKAMKTFEKPDDETGEILIEYPDEETWREQIAGFLRDDFARENRGLHFTYLLKQFGSFKRFGKFQERQKDTEKYEPEEIPPMNHNTAARFEKFAREKCPGMWYTEEGETIIFHGHKLKQIYSEFMRDKNV